MGNTPRRHRCLNAFTRYAFTDAHGKWKRHRKQWIRSFGQRAYDAYISPVPGWQALEAGLNREGSNTTKKRGTEKTEDTFVVSFDVEPYHQGTRHHWTICHSQNPDELVSWGHAPTRELAESAANRELEDLTAGRTEGGNVGSSFKPYTHRIANRNY